MKNIAILLATYNGGKYIKSLLDSLLNQSYQNFVCYIHDDGSTDDTFEVCRNYSWRYPEKFRILYYGHCGGAKENFFSMVKNVEEPYLMFCDQDDIWHDNKLLIMEEIMASHDEINVLVSNYIEFYENSNKKIIQP